MIAEIVIDPGVEWTVKVAAFLAALTTIGVFVNKLWKAYRTRQQRWEDFFEDWGGVPDRDGVPGRLGVMARLAKGDDDRDEMRRQTATIIDSQETNAKAIREMSSSQRELKDRLEYEMSTNGGGSLRDEVRTLGVTTNAIQATVEGQSEEVQTINSEIKKIKDTVVEQKKILTDHLDALPHKEETP